MSILKTAIRGVFAVCTDKVIGYVRVQRKYALHRGQTVLENVWTHAPILRDGTAGKFTGNDATQRAAVAALVKDTSFGNLF